MSPPVRVRSGPHRLAGGDTVRNCDCDPLALTTAVNTLAVSIAAQLGDRELSLTAAVLTQLGDTLATIAVQRELCGGTGGTEER